MEYLAPQAYSLLLPDLFENDTYEEAAHQSTAIDGGYSILDNGAAEGNLAGMAHLFSLARLSCVEEVVIPDAMTDAEQSLYLLRTSWEYIRRQPHYDDLTYMAVLQGKTVDELVDYASKVVTEHLWVKTIGIPRHIAKTCGDKQARLKIIESLIERDIQLEVDLHLLGADYSWPGETLSVTQHYDGIVRGQDTSLPFVFAHYNKRLTSFDGFPTKRPDDYFNLPQSAFPSADLAYNVQLMKCWAVGIA